MNKIISGAMSLIMISALFTQTMLIVAVDTDTPVDVDKSIYDQVVKFNIKDDINKDGIISEDEFKKIDFINISLNDVENIDGLKKAESLRSITLSGGSITDFSVLCSLKNLKTITINNNPVSDVSCFKNMDLNFLYLNDTSVSDEDRISMIKTRDYEIPVGFIEGFSLKPGGMLKTELVIHDSEIAGFGDKGTAGGMLGFYDEIIAKKVGETTYSLMYNEKEIAKGKIKVVPSNIKNPVPDSDGVKVNYIESEYTHNHTILALLTDDKKFYHYDDNKFTMISDNVKTAYDIYTYGTDSGIADYVLKEDGSFIINGKSVFESGVKVSEICRQYAITEDGSLWFIIVNDEGVEKTKISSGCDKFINERLVSKKDGTVILISCSTQKNKFEQAYIYEVAKMNVVDVFNTDNCILDDKGNVWYIDAKNYYSAPDMKLVAENAVKIGGVVLNGSLSGPVYEAADGKIYYCKTGEEIKSVTADDIISKYGYDYYTINDALYQKRSIYAFTDRGSVGGFGIIVNDDRIYGRSVLYKDNSLYMTCLGKYMAVSDVKDSYGTFYDKTANDYSVFILRNDRSLWKYCIGADTLTQITNGMVKTAEPQVTEPLTTTIKVTEPPVTTEPEEEFSITDLTLLSQYMLTGKALPDSRIKKYDINTDGRINIVDVALLKEKLLSTAK